MSGMWVGTTHPKTDSVCGRPRKYVMNRAPIIGMIPKFAIPAATPRNPVKTRSDLLYRISKNCARVSALVSRNR